jgi:hypothetical protein
MLLDRAGPRDLSVRDPTQEPGCRTFVGRSFPDDRKKQWGVKQRWNDMDSRATELERAFQLAKSGECRSVDEIRKKLSSEGYYATQVTGKGLLRQLQGIIAAELEARSVARTPAGPSKPDGMRAARDRIAIDRLDASNDG